MRRDARERILACTNSHPKKCTLDGAALSHTKEMKGTSTPPKRHKWYIAPCVESTVWLGATCQGAAVLGL
jgi:hypothetical protein